MYGGGAALSGLGWALAQPSGLRGQTFSGAGRFITVVCSHGTPLIQFSLSYFRLVPVATRAACPPPLTFRNRRRLSGGKTPPLQLPLQLFGWRGSDGEVVKGIDELLW